jgi:hypothetical protein
MTATQKSNGTTTKAGVSYLAFECGDQDWKLAFSIGMGQEVSLRILRALEMPLLKRAAMP